MRHAFELGLVALVLALFWAAGCVIAAAGLHLFRRIDVMLGYGYGWKDAGVQMRATRRRRDGRAVPVSHPEPEQPAGLDRLKTQLSALGQANTPLGQRLAGLADVAHEPRHAETMIVHHHGNRTALWGSSGRGGDAGPGLSRSSNGRPPWSTGEQPAITEETMTLMQPGSYGYDDSTETAIPRPLSDE